MAEMEREVVLVDVVGGKDGGLREREEGGLQERRDDGLGKGGEGRGNLLKFYQAEGWKIISVD